MDNRHYDAKAPRFKNWETPPDFFKKLDEEFHFTLDAAASHENALVKKYATINGCFEKLPGWDEPAMWFGGNGLEKEWDGYRVFCNPPYDSSISQWVDKAFKFEAEVAVLLLPPNFDTAWGQGIWEAYLWDSSRFTYADCEYVCQNKSRPQPHGVEIRLPPGRLRFWRPAFKNPKSKLKDYEVYGEAIFDYSKPHVPGDAPRAGNLVAIFRR